MTTTSLTRSHTFISAAVGAVAARVDAARHRRARRIALLSLMEMDAHRLDDLGINFGDVMDALGSRGRAP